VKGGRDSERGRGVQEAPQEKALVGIQVELPHDLTVEKRPSGLKEKSRRNPYRHSKNPYISR